MAAASSLAAASEVTGLLHQCRSSCWPVEPRRLASLPVRRESRDTRPGAAGGRLRLSGNSRTGSPVVAMAGSTRVLTGSLTKNEGLRFAVVFSRFNEIVTRLLLEGALETFKRYLVPEENVDVISVPGSFEIPVTTQILANSGKYNAVICIGAVVRGDTTHYDAVANSAASGVLSASLNSGVPCIFGILTCDNMDQAMNRAGGKSGNKGAEAALTAIEMASLVEHHLKA